MKKRPIIIAGILVVILILVLFSIFKKEEAKDIIADKQVGDLLIQKISLVYENNISTLTTKITNTSAEEIYVDNIDIVFLDDKGQKLIRIIGYIGSAIAPNQSRTLVSLYEGDLTDTKDIQFSLTE